ncbi:ABC transporter permease [Mangrovicella endophytica]|uniref:ABC transporter permease n=1 Tax=Mangrovicella endophytica TaxID=2066697 RepID=UPI000C9E00DD|nr:ABC transporter permease [Mangrovicella endophytica]
MINAISGAVADIRKGLGMSGVWVALAHEDVGDAHRRTLLGPAWLLINYLLFAGTFVVIFDDGRTPGFPAYVAVGLLVWLFISDGVSQGIVLFQREQSFIQGTVLPLSIYILRMTMQLVIRAGYALAGCAMILLFFHVMPSVGWLWSILGVMIVLVMMPGLMIICAVAGTVFPDLQFIVGNLIRLGVFLTPVFWVPATAVGLHKIFYHWNPFTYFLEVVRIPIMYGIFPERAFVIAIAATAVTWLTALMLLGIYRKKIVFLL